MKEFGGLDVLVNNAAFQLHVARFEDLTEEHFDRTLKTNLYGYFHMAQAAVPHMEPGAPSSTPARSPASRATRTCSTIR